MEKDVIISIKGTQKYENADQDVIELVTEGRLEPVSYTHLDVYKRQPTWVSIGATVSSSTPPLPAPA